MYRRRFLKGLGLGASGSAFGSIARTAEASREVDVDKAVDSMEQLLHRRPEAHEAVYLAGFYEAGDGGGGHLFVWEPSGADDRTNNRNAHNGVTVINPNHEPPNEPVTADWFDPAKGSATNGWWVRVDPAVLCPEQFGAKGDGTTNDQPAFSAMEQFINNRGFARIELGAGRTYIYGDQVFSGRADGAAYKPVGLMDIRGCDYVALHGNGATLKLDPKGGDSNGFRVGAFDPQTGKPATGPTTNHDRQAGVAQLIFRDVSTLCIENLTIDGSNESVIRGGEWGDTGYQVPGNNLVIRGATRCYIQNVYSHHAVKDGLYIDTNIPGEPINGDDEFNPSELANIHIKNLRSEYNGRQGMSYTGGIGGTFENCDFNHTGKGGINSPPRAGVDIEHGPIHQLNFINCRFLDNNGCGLVHDGSEHTQVTCSGCILWGSDSWSLWNKEPSWVFENCKIYGPTPYACGTFYSCLFQDKPYNGKVPDKGHMFNDISDATFVDCKIRCDRLTFGWFGGENRCSFVRCNFVLGDDGSRKPGQKLGYIRHVKLVDCVFKDDLDNLPDEPYTLPQIGTSEIRHTRIKTKAIGTSLPQ